MENINFCAHPPRRSFSFGLAQVFVRQHLSLLPRAYIVHRMSYCCAMYLDFSSPFFCFHPFSSSLFFFHRIASFILIFASPSPLSYLLCSDWPLLNETLATPTAFPLAHVSLFSHFLILFYQFGLTLFSIFLFLYRRRLSLPRNPCSPVFAILVSVFTLDQRPTNVFHLRM